MSTVDGKGHRITIEEDAPTQKTLHRSGGLPLYQTLCPNCEILLFPVFTLSTKDERIGQLQLWSRTTLEVLVCPRCALYMEPYWVRYLSDEAVVTGGERDGGQILQEVELPYESRAISLGPLEERDPPHRGGRPQSVSHQLGGTPFRIGPVLSCPTCSTSMKFGGVVDYDDGNVPLYEPIKSPVALIIGDRDCLHFYLCRTCDVVGLTWVRS